MKKYQRIARDPLLEKLIDEYKKANDINVTIEEELHCKSGRIRFRLWKDHVYSDWIKVYRGKNTYDDVIALLDEQKEKYFDKKKTC